MTIHEGFFPFRGPVIMLLSIIYFEKCSRELGENTEINDTFVHEKRESCSWLSHTNQIANYRFVTFSDLIS